MFLYSRNFFSAPCTDSHCYSFHCHDWLFLCQSHFPSSLLIFYFCKNDSVWFSFWKRTGCLGKDGGMEEKGKGGKKRKKESQKFWQNFWQADLLRMIGSHVLRWHHKPNHGSSVQRKALSGWVHLTARQKFPGTWPVLKAISHHTVPCWGLCFSWVYPLLSTDSPRDSAFKSIMLQSLLFCFVLFSLFVLFIYL